jgi:hypothetical protein
MNDLPRQKLGELLAAYGRSLCDDPRRCEGLLRDVCGEYKGEIHVLVNALKEGIATDLLGAQNRVPFAVLRARLTQRLQDNLGLAKDAAAWAVESWALALGVITNAKAQSSAADKVAGRKPSPERKRKPIEKPKVATTLRPPDSEKPPAPAQKTLQVSGFRVTDRRVSGQQFPSAGGQTESAKAVQSAGSLPAGRGLVDPGASPTPPAPAKAGQGWIIIAALILIVLLAVYYANQESTRDKRQPVLWHDEPPVRQTDESPGVPPPPPLGSRTKDESHDVPPLPLGSRTEDGSHDVPPPPVLGPAAGEVRDEPSGVPPATRIGPHS